MQSIRPEQIAEFKGRFVDIRNYDEYLTEYLRQAACVPLDKMLTEAGNWHQTEPILLICGKGVRSAKAAEQLEQVGFKQVFTVDGGISACKKAGLEVISERKTIPIFRQVLIGAGILLLIGLALALLDPRLIIIPWFVAAMLVVAGITGFCPMMKILNKMPWNKQPSSSTNKCCPKG